MYFLFSFPFSAVTCQSVVQTLTPHRRKKSLTGLAEQAAVIFGDHSHLSAPPLETLALVVMRVFGVSPLHIQTLRERSLFFWGGIRG